MKPIFKIIFGLGALMFFVKYIRIMMPVLILAIAVYLMFRLLKNDKK